MQFNKILDALKVGFDSLAHSLEKNLQAKIDTRDFQGGTQRANFTIDVGTPFLRYKCPFYAI